MFAVADWGHVVQNFAQIRIWFMQKKRDTSCMKIYRLITMERITGIYSWTRTKYIVLTGNCFGSAAEQNFGGNEKLVYTKKQQTRNMFCMEIKAML